MYYLETAQDKHDRLGFAIFVAAALHATLILGLGFEASRGQDYSHQIEVTLATRPDQAPEAVASRK